MRHQTVVVQTDSGPALVFDIAKKRYVYHGGQDAPVLNLEHTENAQSAWILQFKHAIANVPRTLMAFSPTDEAPDAVDCLAAIDECYGIPDHELVKIAARAYVVNGTGATHDAFVKRFAARLENTTQELGVFGAVPIELADRAPWPIFTVEDIDD